MKLAVSFEGKETQLNAALRDRYGGHDLVSVLEGMLVRFYTRYNPSKLQEGSRGDIRTVAMTYEGRERVLNGLLAKSYAGHDLSEFNATITNNISNTADDSNSNSAKSTDSDVAVKPHGSRAARIHAYPPSPTVLYNPLPNSVTMSQAPQKQRGVFS